MRYTLSLLDAHLAKLQDIMTSNSGDERAAYLFCNLAITDSETRLIVTEVQAPESKFVTSSSPNHITISSTSYIRAMAKADRESKSLIFVHSHPGGLTKFSSQDNDQEYDFFRTAYLRAPNGIHASLIFVGKTPKDIVGRVWDNMGQSFPISRVRIVGKNRLRIFEANLAKEIIHPWADRQVRAFGPQTQKLLGRLNIGIVGSGGTGSAVAEQLIRIGVGTITIIDDQELEETNTTRVYGSRLSDVGMQKVGILERLAVDIGLGTTVNAIEGSICDEITAKQLKKCDLVFGCTDDSLGRKILNRLALWYYIPVIDMAVVIGSKYGHINEITGRVTILSPGTACLSCRGRISQTRLDAQTLQRNNPTLYRERVKQNYAEEIDQTDPSIIMFTTGIAARAIGEFMHILTGFMGKAHTSTEILERFHDVSLGKNSLSPFDNCICGNPTKWGKADETNFLGMLF